MSSRFARMSVSAVEGAVVSNPIAKKMTCRSGFLRAICSASAGEYTMRTSVPRALCSNGLPCAPGTRIMSPNAAKTTSFFLAVSSPSSIRPLGNVDKLDIVRKHIFQAKAIDSVSVTAAHFHDAVMTFRLGKATNFFGSFGNQFGIAEFIDISHHASPEVMPWITDTAACLFSSPGSLSHCAIQPSLPDHIRELRPWQPHPLRA